MQAVQCMRVRVAVALLSFQLLAGCGGESSDLVQATGTITVDGKPAAGAGVTYFPSTTTDATTVASGAADQNGKYTLMSDVKPGIAPGNYKVSVIWRDPAKQKETAMSMGEIKDPPDLLKGRYADPNRSKLTAEVTDSTTELPALELTTK